MTRARAFARRFRVHLTAAAATAGVLTYVIVAGAATPIPVPDPLVVVTTKSGNVTKTHLVPIGGAPIPIDVDGPSVTGILEPDIDVSVGLIAFDELPGKPIAPNVVVARNALALISDRPNPPLELDAKIVLRDAANGLKPLVEVHYGFATPPGARIPPKITAKLVGPIQGGFVDPLQAKIESPGYSGPLNLHINALTDGLDAKFNLDFDSLPESIIVSEDPREDGLDVYYAHAAPVADVHLDANASLRNRNTNELLEIGANIERLPQRISLSNTNTNDRTRVEYRSSSALQKPDIEANYRDFDGNGKVLTDANIKVAGLPFAMDGQIDTVEDGDKRKVDKVDYKALNGDEIGAVDFVVKNYMGPAGNVSSPQIGPDQLVAFSTRQQPDGSARFRAAGRLLGVRAATVEMQGADNDIIDARTDIGDGVRPLRAILDLDDRGPGAPAAPKRMKVDTTIAPLPRTIHTNFAPDTATEPIRLLYESSSTLDVTADVLIATGAADGCGQAEVTCLKARIDKVPTNMLAALPGEGQKDFSIKHNGGATQRPDVRATVDATDENSERTWADVRILRVPNVVTGRLDTENEVLRAAEFHGCTWNFNATPVPACTDALQALGRVSFTVRDRPERGNLPPRPDTRPQYVTLLKRDERFEAAGSVSEVRHVVFHQRDDNDDGEADGTLGARVDAGSGGGFDAVIDDLSDFADPDDTTEPIAILGKGQTKMKIGIDVLPSSFSTCVRENAEGAPPNPSSLSPDPLLAPCDRDDVLGRNSGQLTTTPLSILYKASSKTKVDARIETENPDKDDPIDANTFNRSTSVFATTVDKVPAEIRTDVISPVTPDPDASPAIAGRKLEMDYDASERIGRIDFEMQARRSNSICEDPRPNRRATCLSAVVTDLPKDIFVSYDPDDSKGDIEFITAAPKESNGGSCTNGTDNDGDGLNDATDPDCVRLSLNKDVPAIPDPMRLSIVEPEPTSQPLVLDARVTDITDHLKGKLVSKDVDGEAGLGPSKCFDSLDNDSDSGDTGGGIDAADDDCEKDMAELSFDACPDGDCPGIGEITFKATNALIGDPVPQPDPATSTIGGVTQDFSFVQREELFRAQGKITKLKRIGLSQLDQNANPSATTQIEAAFGSGLPSEKLRAYLDTDSGAEQLVADAVISQAPSGINVCLRDAIPSGSDFVSNGSSSIYCETAPNDQMGMQIKLDEAAGSVKPDIDLRKLRVASGGGTSLITGDAQVDNLGERIDILIGKQAKDGDIFVEGQQITDDNSVPVNSAPDNVADRVTFNLRNREVAPSGAFPWTSLENGDADPLNNTVDVEAVAAGNDGNYLKFFTDAAGRFIARGSVPNIKRIAKRSGSCETDVRFPDPAGYPATKVPAYQCLDANVAGNSKLGLNVRTLDAANEVLEVEEGHVTAMPSGGLQVTLAKSPDAAGLDPVCTDPATAFPCRPPMLSLEAPRGAAAVPRLRARLSTGAKDLIVNKIMPQVADDVISKNLNYEQAPVDFAEAGARVKVGTDKNSSGKELLGIRMNANLPLHQFLDLDPPTLWSCKHDDDHPDPNPATDCSAPDAEASSDKNEGYESKDIFFKLVAADNHHDGSDVPFLGRVAVLVQDYKSGGTQTVLSGAPGQAGNPGLPDNQSWFIDRPGTDDFDNQNTADPVTGADSRFPEHFAAAGDPSHLGFRVPGHLDAKVYLRNDYEAPGDDDKQQNFAQVDGRVNSPLTMAVRLNDGTTTNRAGQAVPPTQLTLRNAPGTNGNDNYADPSFRVRAELKKGHVDQTPPDLAEKIFTCDGAGYGIQIPALLTVCLLVPTQAQAQWLNVALNLDPQSNGNTTTSNPARTVDAVAGPFGGSNDADLRAFSQVNGTGGDADVNKGTGAAMVPQAGLRLTNFNIGLKVGAGIGLIGGSVTWVEEGDLIVGLTGHESERARLNHNLLVMRLSGGTEANPNRINSNLKSIFRFKVTVEALFGLVEGDVFNETIGPFHHDIVFRDCLGSFLALGGTADQFLSPSPDLLSNQKASIAFGSTGDLGGDLAAAFNNVLTGIGSQIFCLFSTSDSKDVNSSHPAPSYNASQRLVEDGPGAAAGSAPPDPPDVGDDTRRQDLTISATTPAAQKTRCGLIVAKNFTVDSGQTLRVGREGEFDGLTGQACGGSLDIDAQEVDIDGTIDAIGARTNTNGPGTPGGTGGGAGHHGTGGPSGSGSGGGPAAPGPTVVNPNPPPATLPINPLVDFGSAGANGTTGAGGRGGGTIRIRSITDIVVNGLVSARGMSGGSSGAACSNVGGGGGSGGAISVSGTRVVGTGAISVNGGNGGSAAQGGGGGSSGRLTINTVVVGNSLFIASGGSGATGLANCIPPSPAVDSGGDGTGGTTSQGTILDRAAGVFLHDDNPGPFVKGSVKLVVKGVQQPTTLAEDDLDIILCRKYLAPENTNGPFEDPALDPGPGATLDGLLGSDTCDVEEFSAPTIGDDRYERTVTVSLPTDGFYGWYAIAAHRADPPFGSAGEEYCAQTHTGSFFDPDCDYQSQQSATGDSNVTLPVLSQARIGSDTVAPAYDTPAANRPLNGFAGCPDGSLCLPDATAKLKIEASDRTSGIKGITCTVSGGPAGTQLCPEGPSVNVDVGLNDGLKSVNVRLEDNADDPPETVGNVNNVNPAATWFTDRTKPNKPVVTLGACGGGSNGWCTSIPTISASAADPNPSSGFDADALSVLIDEAGTGCGSAAAGSSSGSGTTGISCPAGTVNVTTEGRHTISATATDRLGNESDRADAKTMKVDTTAPNSAIFLGPKKPDGASQWYVTEPFFAFGATDKAGGSGVDRDIAPSGIFYAVDGGPSGTFAASDFVLFDPDADLRLDDGVHEICWYAVDVAGNEEVGGDPKDNAPATNCKANIKVDTTPPNVHDPISPVLPNGDNSFYITTPTVDGSADDPQASGVNTVSLVDRVEMRIDDGDWTTAAPTDITEGEHVVLTRAFDVAGNGSPILERIVRVDTSDPSAKMVSYPPLPNDQFWWRRHLSDSVASYDGRDGSGADGATFSIDGDGPSPYLAPFPVVDGKHTVDIRARDFAGRQGAVVSTTQRVDTVAPFAAPVGVTPVIVLPLLGLPKNVPLNFTAADFTPRVKVVVDVYNVLGSRVRSLPAAGPHPGGYRDPGQGSVLWNGRDANNKGVAPGLYVYRVRAIDQAGNTVLSDESPPFLVVLGVLPL